MGDLPKKVERTAREQLKILNLRDNRLAAAGLLIPPNGDRAHAILRARVRLWAEERRLQPLAMNEERDELWPNGLPAHP